MKPKKFSLSIEILSGSLSDEAAAVVAWSMSADGMDEVNGVCAGKFSVFDEIASDFRRYIRARESDT